jgi:hypothetical protein
MDFNWQTDESDEGWENESALSGSRASSWWRQPAVWRTASVLLFLLLLAGWIILRLAARQVSQATDERSTGILTVHSLLQQAAFKDDIALLETFLTENDSYSRQLPLDLFRYGYFLDRPALNLYALDIPPETEPDVTFSPDFSRAELLTRQAYRTGSNPTAGTVWLERLTLFRRDGDRWQLSRWPIDESFWGEWQEVRYGRLAAEFPGRDETPGRRLAQEMSRLLDQICDDPAMRCPPNFRLKLLLVPYGQNLLALNQNYRTLPLSSGYDAYRIFLPAPTLVGRPIDEAGYQALYRGYAAWTAAVLVQHYSQQRPVTHDVTAAHLARWQLVPPPMPGLPAPLPAAAAPPPIPLPDQPIHFVCQGYSPATWISYHPAADSWQTVPAPPNAPALAHLLQQAGQQARFPPAGQGSLIRRPVPVAGVESWRSFLWLGGLTPILEIEDGHPLLLTDPTYRKPVNDHLLFYPFDGLGTPYLADTAGCLAGSCRLQSLSGQPVWSPSGSQTLLTISNDPDRPQLFQGDSQGRPARRLLPGHAPQWLDEESYLYVGPKGTTIYTGRLAADANDDEPEPLVDVTGFLSGLGFKYRPGNPVITYFAVHPTRPDSIVINVTDRNTPQDILLSYTNSEVSLLAYGPFDLRLTWPMQITDDGRFLSIAAFETGTQSGGWHLVVIDLDPPPNGQSYWRYATSTAYHDFSADGEWLLVAEDNTLRLIAPHHNYEREVPHKLECHTAGWADSTRE